MSRIEFSAEIKRTVAARNGYRCSFPACDQTTTGPGSGSMETISTGVAAHIYSSSPGGPRGQSTFDADELGSIENALWVCSDHSRLIDANRGGAFSPALLVSYKSAHEGLIAFEQRGVSFGFGWLQSLVVGESPVFVRGARLDLAKTTVVLGSNASGKTAICEWLAGCRDISFLKRWAALGQRGRRTQVSFNAIAPLPVRWTIKIFEESNIQFEIDGAAVPRLTLNHAFVYAPAPPRSQRPDESISEYLAFWLRVDRALIHNVVRSLASHGGHRVNNTRFVSVDGREDLLADVDGTIAGLSFESLSGSEQKRVVLELAIELARFEAERNPTMLLIDCMGQFDQRHFEDYLGFISSQQGFQSILTATTGNTKHAPLHAHGAHVAMLHGAERDVIIGV